MYSEQSEKNGCFFYAHIICILRQWTFFLVHFLINKEKNHEGLLDRRDINILRLLNYKIKQDR